MHRLKPILDAGQPINWSSPLTRGLSAWWMVSPGGHPAYRGGNRLLDLCGLYHGNLSSSPPWQGSLGRQGGYGSLSLNGSSQYVACAATKAVDTKTFTYSAWVRSTSHTADMGVLTEASSSSNSPFGWLSMTAGKSAFYIRDDAASETDTVGAKTIDDGKWHCIAATYDGSRVVLYTDGAEETNASASKTTITTDQTTIGSLVRIAPGFYYSGDADDCGIWKRVLTASEIAALYLDGLRGHPQMLNWVSRTACFLNATAAAPITSPLIHSFAVSRAANY